MEDKKVTPMKAIRLKCLECSGSAHEVKLCSAEKCPLHCYRFGKNPSRAGIGGFGVRQADTTSDSAEIATAEGMDIPQNITEQN